MHEQAKLKELTWILPGTGFFCSEDLCFFFLIGYFFFFQSVTTFILGREKATQGKSAEGEREEPETDNRNQNSSSWGRKDFKASKKPQTTQTVVVVVRFFRGRQSGSSTKSVPHVLWAKLSLVRSHKLTLQPDHRALAHLCNAQHHSCSMSGLIAASAQLPSIT